jgi:hypothetical protein
MATMPSHVGEFDASNQFRAQDCVACSSIEGNGETHYLFILNGAKDLPFSSIKEKRVGRLISGKKVKNRYKHSRRPSWNTTIILATPSFLQVITKNTFILAGYSHGYPLDPYVVLSPTRGAASSDGFWVQPFGDGSSRFIQPVRMAVA